MPRINRPYYNLHQIDVGKYSDDGTMVLADGTVYEGSFHILPNGQRFTGFQPEDKSVELFLKRLNPTQDIITYNKNTSSSINQYVSPLSYQPIPTVEEYKNGKMERFFIQKRTSPNNTITEIDNQQYNQINTENNPGINGIIWNKVKLTWMISKIGIESARYLNEQSLAKANAKFVGIGTFITNPLEFYK